MHCGKSRNSQFWATDIQSGQVHLDAEVPSMPRSTWAYDDQPVFVPKIEGDITAQTNWQFETGTCVTHRIHHSSPAEVLHQLGEHWQSRWIASAPPSESDWDRVSNFAKGYMPTIRFRFPPISERQWRKALHRFKPGAARSADGYQHTDLARALHTYTRCLASSTPSRTSKLLGLINCLRPLSLPLPNRMTRIQQASVGQ